MAENVRTDVTQVELDLEDILNPGADAVLLPGEELKNKLWTRNLEDIKFLDKFDKEEPPALIVLSEEEKAKKIASGELNLDGSVKVILTDKEINDLTIEETDATKKTGRPKVDKQGLVELTNKLFEKKLLVPFDDGKAIEEYTLADFEELFEANATEKERKLREDVPGQFFDSLPEEMQYAAKYIADGGNDLKGLFRLLAATEEVRELDVKNDAETIVRTYLQATNFGTSEDIQEEVDAWKDRGEIEAKANKFKPKLDAMQEEILAFKVQEQENKRKSQMAQAKKYQENIYNMLEPAELNGVKLDKKVQSMLYAGLTQPNYPSVNGKQTNMLGHLLEKYQFVEPNHGLIAEALWLLADPDSYRAKIREAGEKKAVEKTVRTLKTEEARKLGGGGTDDELDTKKTGKLARPSTAGFFKR